MLNWPVVEHHDQSIYIHMVKNSAWHTLGYILPGNLPASHRHTDNIIAADHQHIEKLMIN